MDDLEAGEPLPGVCLVVVDGDAPATYGVGVYEPDGTGVGAGSNQMISAETPRAEALVTLAEALQEKCAETSAGWGQSRPPCPYHAHPLRAELREGEAWWVCQRCDQAVHRIGSGEVLAAARSDNGPGGSASG